MILIGLRATRSESIERETYFELAMARSSKERMSSSDSLPEALSPFMNIVGVEFTPSLSPIAMDARTGPSSFF